MKFSTLSLLFCFLIIVLSGTLFYPRWQKNEGEAQISWDASGYYWYLPSLFIYHDIKGQHFKDSILQKYRPVPPDDFQQAFKHQSGNYVLKYTIGQAILEAPFFAIAHIVARPLGFPADGFSLPYQFMIYIGGLLFGWIGLWYLRKLLLFYYSDTVVALTMLFLVLGTNYLNYSGIDVAMSHTWLFTLYVLLILNTHYYYHTLKIKYAIVIGLLIGIMTLVRLPEIISLAIPLLWGMHSLSLSAMGKKLLFYKKQLLHLSLAGIACFLILSIQLVYWQYASGQWLIYTYGEQGFSWLKPHIFLYALNFQCGWLRYTPIMFFVFPALLIFLIKGKNKIAILFMIFVNYYVVAAWDLWDYGGRAMVQGYAVLLFPIASFMEFILRKKIYLIIATPFLLLGAYFNLWWTYQAHKGGLIGSIPSTPAYYYATIFRYNVALEFQKLRDNQDWYRRKIKEPVLLYSPNLNMGNKEDNATIAGDKQVLFKFETSGKKFKWIRASATVHIDQKESNIWLMTHFIIKLKKGNDVVQENYIRVQRLLNEGETRNVTLDAKVKNEAYDDIELVFRNENNGPVPCYINNVSVIGFDQ